MTRTKNLFAVITSLVILSFVVSAFAAQDTQITSQIRLSDTPNFNANHNGYGLHEHLGNQGNGRYALGTQHRGYGNGNSTFTRAHLRSKNGECDGSGRRLHSGNRTNGSQHNGRGNRR